MPMSDIQHVVVLMLENQSFDTMVGWLYGEDTPVIIPPAAPDDGFRGLHSIDLTQFINSANIGQ
jgi:phospholipase C